LGSVLLMVSCHMHIYRPIGNYVFYEAMLSMTMLQNPVSCNIKILKIIAVTLHITTMKEVQHLCHAPSHAPAMWLASACKTGCHVWVMCTNIDTPQVLCWTPQVGLITLDCQELSCYKSWYLADCGSYSIRRWPTCHQRY
jgi:hypothetical protein